MESSKSNPLQEENLASIRRKNTLLIAILFSFSISLSLILGGFIIYPIFIPYSPSPTTNPAVNGFCSVTESRLGCITELSSSNIKPFPFTHPIHVYTLSLESAFERLSLVGSNLSASDSDNCSTSLRAGMGRIDEALAVMRVNPDNEARLFEQRGGMVELIEAAMEELRPCRESTAVGAAAGAEVYGIELLLRYCRDYLLKFDLANGRFRIQVIVLDEERSRNPILGVLADSVAVFGLQYFVLVFLFILILLRCNFCYIGGCCHRV